MKRLLLAFFISSFVFIATAFAAQTPEPTVNDPLSPVDAPKAVISGTSEPGARIVVTGGPYDISPVSADSSGNFSVTVGLAQETTNTFQVTAKDGDDEQSDAVTITIVESAAQAAASEASGGGDHTAPAAPELDYESVETAAVKYIITGTGEADANIFVNDADSGYDVDEDGNISFTVNLTGSGTKDKFKISLGDAAGNLGSSTTIYVTSSGTASAGDDDDDNDDDDNDTSNPFTDTSGHWGETYILDLYNRGVISGYGDGTFGPNDPVTRAQILKIAVEAFNVITAENKAQFSDVDSGDWFSDYVDSGYSNDIVQGYSDGTFRPNDQVTRAAALKIILEAADLNVHDVNFSSNTFGDLNQNDWFADYAIYAHNAGFVSGYSDGEFKGAQSITRAEVCKIVMEVIDVVGN